MRPKARWIIVKYHSRPLPVIAHVSFFAFAVIWLSIIATSGRRIPAAYLFIKWLRFEGVARTRLLLSSMIYVHWLSDVTKWHHNTGNKILLNSNSRAFRKKKLKKRENMPFSQQRHLPTITTVLQDYVFLANQGYCCLSSIGIVNLNGSGKANWILVVVWRWKSSVK